MLKYFRESTKVIYLKTQMRYAVYKPLIFAQFSACCCYNGV